MPTFDLHHVIEGTVHLAKIDATNRLKPRPLSPKKEAEVRSITIATFEAALSDMVAAGSTYLYRGHIITPCGDGEEVCEWNTRLPDGRLISHTYLEPHLRALDAIATEEAATHPRVSRYNRASL